MTSTTTVPSDTADGGPGGRTTDTAVARRIRPLRGVSLLVVAAGAVLMVSGAATWATVQGQLADEKIAVADDARSHAGEPVRGPFTAYAQADVIEHHALEASGGKTYAQLDRQDPRRQTVMTASFLRASLFTSVVSFGIAAMAFGLGLVFVLVGAALLLVARSLAAQG